MTRLAKPEKKAGKGNERAQSILCGKWRQMPRKPASDRQGHAQSVAAVL